MFRPVSTKLALEVPFGYYALVVSPKDLISERYIIALPSVIEWDYHGEVKIHLAISESEGLPWKLVFPGERIAQLIVLPKQEVVFKQVFSQKSKEERNF